MKSNRGMLVLRSVLALLILLNVLVIFNFSLQNASTSSQTSGRVTTLIAEWTVDDFDELDEIDREAILSILHPRVRKLAHMAEFGSLGTLILLLSLTWKSRLWLQYVLSLLSVLCIACIDEVLQLFSNGRATQISDILTDLFGALLCTSLTLGILFLYRHIRNALKRKKGAGTMKTTYYTLKYPNVPQNLRIAIASDLHNNAIEKTVLRLRAEVPDLILIPGDLMDDIQMQDEGANGYRFLKECVSIAPTYYSLGNHEIGCYHGGKLWSHPVPHPIDPAVIERVKSTGAIYLDNECVKVGGLTVCGLTSGINGKVSIPDPDALKAFANEDGFRILLCHHPEYFYPYIKETGIELTVAGHAHGGQWRMFGQGIYSPGQGLFPRYTAGILEGRCVISRGLGNHTWIPRIFNTPELILLTLERS